jgi:hypothetical protein
MATAQGPAAKIAIDYPQDGSIFPPEITAPTAAAQNAGTIAKRLVNAVLPQHSSGAGTMRHPIDANGARGRGLKGYFTKGALANRGFDGWLAYDTRLPCLDPASASRTFAAIVSHHGVLSGAATADSGMRSPIRAGSRRH